MPDISRYRELAKGNKNILNDLIAPPYDYTVKYLDRFNKYSKEEKYLQILRDGMGDIGIEHLKELYDSISPTLKIDINKTLRLVEIEEDLINLVKNTDNNIFHRPLFFPTVFINNNIEYDDAIIKGILISEAITHGEGQQILYGDIYKDYEKYANDYAIAFILIDRKINFVNISLLSLITEEKIQPGLTDTEIRSINIDNFVRNMVVNIVDMVEGIDRDLSVITIETTKEQNLKRIKRGQLPFPTKVFIKAQGEFKKYVQKFNTDVQEYERRKILHKFMVRGHWRHFRSERYKIETKAKPKWIKPFWKGEGIPIAKEYKLVH